MSKFSRSMLAVVAAIQSGMRRKPRYKSAINTTLYPFTTADETTFTASIASNKNDNLKNFKGEKSDITATVDFILRDTAIDYTHPLNTYQTKENFICSVSMITINPNKEVLESDTYITKGDFVANITHYIINPIDYNEEEDKYVTTEDVVCSITLGV